MAFYTVEAGMAREIVSASDIIIVASTVILFTGNTLSTLNPFSSIGDLLVLSGSAIMMMHLVLFRAKRSTLRYIFWISAFVIYNIANLYIFPSDRGLRHTVSLISMAIVVVYFVHFGVNVLSKGYLSATLVMLFAANIIASYFTDTSKNVAAGTFTYCLLGLALIVLHKRGAWTQFVGIVIVSFVVVSYAYVANFRGMIIFGMLFAVFFITFRIVGLRKTATIALIAVFIYLSVIVVLYAQIGRSSWGAELNHSISLLTGRLVSSGREIIWPAMLSQIQASPIVGWGSGALPRDFIHTEFSTHNYYMQITLQTGLIGLGLMMCFLVSIKNDFLRSEKRTNFLSSFGCATFLMFVAHNGSEVLMFQNGTIAAIPAWITIAICLSATFRAAARSLGQ